MAQEPPGTEVTMLDRKEYGELLFFLDQMICTSEPRRAEYLRGYRRGFRDHVLGVLPEKDEHIWWSGSSGSDSGDHVNAYTRGYRDGCKGLKPEDN